MAPSLSGSFEKQRVCSFPFRRPSGLIPSSSLVRASFHPTLEPAHCCRHLLQSKAAQRPDRSRPPPDLCPIFHARVTAAAFLHLRMSPLARLRDREATSRSDPYSLSHVRQRRQQVRLLVQSFELPTSDA